VPTPAADGAPTEPFTAPTRTPTPLPGKPIAPIAEGATVRFDSWSPDSRRLAYWVFEADFLTIIPLDAASTLHIHDLDTGQTCAHPQLLSQDSRDTLTWQSPEQFIVSTGSGIWQGAPCGEDFTPVEGFAVPTPIPPDPGLSPGGDYLAATAVLTTTGGIVQLLTTLAEAATGTLLHQIEWEVAQGLGDYAGWLGGEWITDRQFLIWETRRQGPLLVEAAGGVIEAAPALFGVPAEAGPDVTLRAVAAPAPGGEAPHLLLIGAGVEANFPPVRLYHPETGQVEALQYTHLWGHAFSPDGRWVLQDARPIRDGYESYALWARPIDPPSGVARLIGEGAAAWSADWTRVAFGLDRTLTAVTFPEAAGLGAWVASEQYSLFPRAWSPNGRWLAVEGATGRPQMALFVVEVAAPGAATSPGHTSGLSRSRLSP
jgi:hypothetical protein